MLCTEINKELSELWKDTRNDPNENLKKGEKHHESRKQFADQFVHILSNYQTCSDEVK